MAGNKGAFFQIIRRSFRFWPVVCNQGSLKETRKENQSLDELTGGYPEDDSVIQITLGNTFQMPGNLIRRITKHWMTTIGVCFPTCPMS